MRFFFRKKRKKRIRGLCTEAAGQRSPLAGRPHATPSPAKSGQKSVRRSKRPGIPAPTAATDSGQLEPIQVSRGRSRSPAKTGLRAGRRRRAGPSRTPDLSFFLSPRQHGLKKKKRKRERKRRYPAVPRSESRNRQKPTLRTRSALGRQAGPLGVRQ